MNKYDDRLYFELPEDYYALANEEEDGSQSFVITAVKTTNDKGEDQYKFNAGISKADPDTDADSGSSPAFRIKGRFPAYAECMHTELQILTRKMFLFEVMIRFSQNDAGYVIHSRRAAGDNDAERDETLKDWIRFLNTVLSCAVLDGEKGEFDAFSLKDLLDVSKDMEEVNAEESGMPYAKPAEGQHTHLDFLNKTKGSLSLLGNLIQVNQNGTEFSLQPVAEMESEQSELNELYDAIGSADQGTFELAETAGEMAKLFRVTLEFFDAGHDREQEIYAGLIQREAVYESFRSFAWTLGAYCEKEKKRPEELSLAEISRIVEYIGRRDGLNYTENSFSPVICSGDDIHVLYLPDSVPAEIKEKLREGTDTQISSLDGLRRELEYMYPAIKKIYDSLAASRDPEVPLTGPEADILYAWCTITHAAVQAVYSEDGPMNCWWEHPDEELNRRKQRIQQEIDLEEKWIRENQKYLTRNEKITVRDRAFVFAGVEHREHWEEINERFTQMGGIYRSAVSGKTDYLVCDPPQAGESKLKKALEQKEKGKNVKIILLEDFLKAIGLTLPTRRDLLKELEEDAAKTNSKPAKISEKSDADSASELPEVFTYEQGLKAHGDGYVMDIPDGFVIQEGVEGRHFAAFIPDEQSPDDYRESRFFILAGKRQDYEAVKSLASIAEYVALGKGIAVGTAGYFKNSVVKPYKRDDLPGDIIYGFEEGCVFVNAIFGIDDHMQMMRMQMNNVDLSASAGYMKLTESLFDHMRAEKPVRLLESPDSVGYLDMDLDGDTPGKWMANIDDHINHLTIARNMSQTFLVEGYKKDQASGKADLQKLKKNLKDLLREISGCADEVLEKAEKVFALKASQYPDHEKLLSMSEKVLTLADFADQYVSLGEQEIRVDSELAKEVRKRLEAVKEAKRKAEEEERKKQEQKRLEEERQLQEKKKREAEERQKEIDQYHTDYKNWEIRCQEILNERKAYVEEKLSSRQKEIEEEARKEYDLAVESLKKEQAEQEERESTAQARLSSLGMFRFSEKKEQKAIIEDAISRISAAKDALMQKERELRDRLSAASGEAKKETQKFNVEAIAKLPLPEEPPKPAAVSYEEEQERKKKEEEERRRKEQANKLTTDEEKALSWLGDYGISADELADYMGISIQKASLFLTRLVVKGKAERYVEKRKAYFRRKD